MRFTELGPREEILYSLYTKMNDITVITISQDQKESLYFALRILKNLLTQTMNEGNKLHIFSCHLHHFFVSSASVHQFLYVRI